MKRAGGLLIVGLIGWQPFAMATPPAWEPLGQGLTDAKIMAVAVDLRSPRLIYAASSSAVYASRDGGMSWRACLQLPTHTEITRLVVDPFDGQRVLAATTNGLYGSLDGGRRWTRLFRGAGTGESRCQVVLVHPSHRHQIFLGTAGGLFMSADGGQHWQKLVGQVSNQSVRSLAIDPQDPDRIYALTDQGLFVGTEEATTWDKRLPTLRTGEPVEEPGSETSEEPQEEPEPSRRLTTLAIDPQDHKRLYLGSLDGLFVSRDAGMTWQRVTQLGLGTAQIHHLILHAHSPMVAYAATPQGVARYDPQENRWEILYSGLPTQAVHFLAATQSRVFAATDQGLYTLDLTEEQLAQGNWPSAKEILGNFVYEPTIEQVRQTAIRYAEVEPEKIQRWRRQAYLQAFFPTLKIDYDRDNDTYISSSVTSTATRVFQTEDPSNSLGFSLNWDLAKLIWNDDQTSIDTRSRLTVQLRDDILNEATRAYFERRRLQVELLTDPPNDPKVQLDKELRLQELTAMIDGLTGGWFSKQLEMNGGR